MYNYAALRQRLKYEGFTNYSVMDGILLFETITLNGMRMIAWPYIGVFLLWHVCRKKLLESPREEEYPDRDNYSRGYVRLKIEKCHRLEIVRHHFRHKTVKSRICGVLSVLDILVVTEKYQIDEKRYHERQT